MLEAHCDTLGGMVAEVKSNGRLRLTNIGGMKPANAEAENVRILTKGDGIYEGVCQLINASVHVNGDYEKTERNWDTIEVLVDEPVNSKEEPFVLLYSPAICATGDALYFFFKLSSVASSETYSTVIVPFDSNTARRFAEKLDDISSGFVGSSSLSVFRLR